MKNIKIGPKLIVSFLFTAALTAFLGIYVVQRLYVIDELDDEIYEKAVVPLGFLSETGYLAQEIRLQAREWRLAKTDEARANALKTLDDLNGELRELIVQQKERVLQEAGKKPLNDMQAVVSKFADEMHAYAKNHTERCPLSGITTADFPNSMLEAGMELKKAFEIAKNMRTNNAKNADTRAGDLRQEVIDVTIRLLIAVIVISIVLGIFLTRSIVKPLGAVVNTISKIEKGDMTARAELVRGDELGVLSKAIDTLSARLQNIFRNLQQNSETIASSAEELSSIGKEVTGAIKQVSVNITAMSGGAEQASNSANEVAGAAEEMSTNMNTIAAAVEQMSSSISQISSNAGDAKKIATQATIRSREATDTMSKLGNAAKEIGQVTSVIKKIADKTNLLALNATIEAASAGAAGKGFAVVAGEIKELANQSAQSADDIARRIEGIQAGTSEAVTVISGVSDVIEKINLSVESISNHVSQQTKASNEISNNVGQANVGSKRVASAINEVAKGSRDIANNAGEAARGASNIQGATQINQSSNELARIAGDLKNVLRQFKV